MIAIKESTRAFALLQRNSPLLTQGSRYRAMTSTNWPKCLRRSGSISSPSSRALYCTRRNRSRRSVKVAAIQLKGARNRGPGVVGFRNPGQQVATQFHFLQLGIEHRDIKIALARIMPVNRDLVHTSAGCNIARAHAVIAEIGKHPRCAGQNPRFGAALSGDLKFNRHVSFLGQWLAGWRASAAGMFANFGYNGVSTRDIAAGAGVNEVTIYRHYPRKRDLYVAVLDAELQEVSRAAICWPGLPKPASEEGG